MKSIFIDCNDQLDAVFARVYRPDDPPIVVNTHPVEASALPGLIDGYDICLDDHSYMPTEAVALQESSVPSHADALDWMALANEALPNSKPLSAEERASINEFFWSHFQ